MSSVLINSLHVHLFPVHFYSKIKQPAWEIFLRQSSSLPPFLLTPTYVAERKGGKPACTRRQNVVGGACESPDEATRGPISTVLKGSPTHQVPVCPHLCLFLSFSHSFTHSLSSTGETVSQPPPPLPMSQYTSVPPYYPLSTRPHRGVDLIFFTHLLLKVYMQVLVAGGG